MKKKVRGFTLIELIVVIAIISVLSAITVPNVIRQIRSNRVNEANTKAQQIYSATADYLVTLQRQGKIAKEYFDPTTSYATTTNDIFFFGFNPVFLDGSHTEAEAYQISNGSNFLHIPGVANSANLTATKIGIIKNLSGSASGARTGSGGTGWWTEGAWIVAVNVNTYSVVGAWYYPNPKNGNGSVNYSFD
ncbi:MAG: type II secretion system protein, partial [Oscillospiraceae bacterium]|nr:type II secretion system protein [Oscillospiraceae bacterium]